MVQVHFALASIKGNTYWCIANGSQPFMWPLFEFTSNRFRLACIDYSAELSLQLYCYTEFKIQTTCTVLSNEVLNINLPILQQINITRKTVNYVLFMQSTNDSKRHSFNPGAIYFFMSALLRYRREWPNLLQQHASIVSSEMLIHILFEKYKTGPTPFPVTWR